MSPRLPSLVSWSPTQLRRRCYLGSHLGPGTSSFVTLTSTFFPGQPYFLATFKLRIRSPVPASIRRSPGFQTIGARCFAVRLLISPLSALSSLSARCDNQDWINQDVLRHHSSLCVIVLTTWSRLLFAVSPSDNVDHFENEFATDHHRPSTMGI